MAAPDYAACLYDLSRTGAVYQPLGDLTKDGCALSGAVQLQRVVTNFGAVTISGEPIMLCSFARQFVGWVRDIGAPLTLAKDIRNISGATLSSRHLTDGIKRLLATYAIALDAD